MERVINSPPITQPHEVTQAHRETHGCEPRVCARCSAVRCHVDRDAALARVVERGLLEAGLCPRCYGRLLGVAFLPEDVLACPRCRESFRLPAAGLPEARPS